jgi:ABC-2 type transport system ATP-binding protein
LMRKLGKRRLTLTLRTPMSAIPAALADWPLELDDNGRRLIYSFGADGEGAGIPVLLGRLGQLGVDYKDLDTSASTLEDIFVDLIGA